MEVWKCLFEKLLNLTSSLPVFQSSRLNVMTTRTFYIDFYHQQDHAIDYFLGMLDKTRSTTLQKIKNFTVEELDWQCRPGWNTIGALLLHTIALEHYFRIEFVEGRKLTPGGRRKMASGIGSRSPCTQTHSGSAPRTLSGGICRIKTIIFRVLQKN